MTVKKKVDKMLSHFVTPPFVAWKQDFCFKGANIKLPGHFEREVSADKIAALAPAFTIEMDVLDFHTFVDGFAHVVDGQQGNADGMQGFHLNPGLAGYFDRSCCLDCTFGCQQLKFYAALGNRQRVA